ncbi:MAG: hypothetical protein [Cressdnaviricota sp.]|nr:MAG: hypothetical protein [Cressdnaviricota sp.]
MVPWAQLQYHVVTPLCPVDPSGECPSFVVMQRWYLVRHNSCQAGVFLGGPLVGRIGLSFDPLTSTLVTNDMPDGISVYPKSILLSGHVSTQTFPLILVKHILRFHM